MRFPRPLLIRLRLWHEPADLPVVATLVAWPKRAFLVLAVAWLSGYVNAREDPRPPQLLFAQFTAAGDTTQSSEGRQIMNAVELANFAMLLYKLKPPPLLAILPQLGLVLIDMKGYILSVGILPCLLLWNRVLLAVTALECLALPVRHSMQCPLRAGEEEHY